FWLDNILVEEVEDGGDGDGSLESNGYRYGFNGKENDNEISGEGNNLDFGARIYDSRLARWLSVDAKAGKYPSISAYAFCLNNPIVFIDPDGNDVILFDQKGNKVATITKAGTVIEKGMENSAILKSYVATKAYFKGTSAEADFTDFENASKILNIKETSKPEGAANFQNSGFKNVSGIDANGNKTLEVEEITNADYMSATEFGTIEWNPLTGGIDAEGNRHSPAMIFAHELKHAKHFKNNLVKFIKDLLTKKKGVDDVEEENAINETNTLSKEKANGDGGNGADKKRTTHGAKGLFKAKSTTSNQAAPAPVKKKR
ncbi:RHS repeat-associated core domain-containing protein, partial [Polluticaenibacter yanchengensis]|nr:RHS repeat-associated core domain-containing protein [Chitinophagaceae bacterium LY-5]